MTHLYLRSCARLFLALCLLLCTLPSFAQQSWRPGEVLLLLRKDARPEAVRTELQRRLPTAVVLKEMTPLGRDSRYHLVRLDGTGIDEPTLERLLAQAPGVEATSLNYVLELRAQPNDALYADQWGMAAIDVEPVWNITTGGSMANGRRIAVGIVDALVQTTHPDLADNISPASTYAGEGSEHGTMVAGVVGATGNNGIGVSGVNWDVDLVPLGYGGTMAGAISGFEGALSLREDFTNSAGTEGALVVAVTVSWGLLGTSCGFGYAIFEDLGNAGVLAITAGPNEPVDIDVVPDFPSGCPNSNNIAVTCIGPNGENPFAVGNSTIHLQAPGLEIPTTSVNGGYVVTDGNSFAVPHVAGAVALLYSAPCPAFAQLVMTDPAAAAQLVKSAILQGGAPVPGGNNITITGRQLNVLGAYQMLMAQCIQTCTDLTMTFTPTEGTVAEAVITGPQGNVVTTASGPVLQGCWEDGCYQASFSAAGGAPVGGSWSVTDGAANVVDSGTSANGQVSFSFGTIVPGCTTPNSGNFDPGANCNDGSCCPGDIVRVKVLAEDLVSEGTAQVTITVGGSVVHDGPVAITAGADPEFGVGYAVGTVELCAPDGCMSIAVTSGSTPLHEVGFVYIGNDGPIPFQLADGHLGAVGNAGGLEVCDGQDNDCDGEVDEDFRWYADADGDGFGDPATLQIACSPVPGAVQNGIDCNDADATITAVGSACDDGDPNTLNDFVRSNCQCAGIDQGSCPPGEIPDCNGNCAPADWLGDGLCNNGSMEWQGNLIVFTCAELNNDGGDCFDPCGPEICDGLDNDCDGEVDEDHTWYTDADGDGFGDDATATVSCLPPLGAVLVGGDCDDGNNAVHPGATEACDTIDNDCDGAVDEDFIWYEDADGDGLGNDATVQFSCTPLSGFVHVGGDCNDSDAGIAGVGAACDDGNPATVYDIVRTDCQCQGFIQGTCPPGQIEDCNGNCAPVFWLADGLCDDGSSMWEGNLIFLNCPGLSYDMGDCSIPCLPETCDGLDNDCDGAVDEDFVWYTDADGDGYGDDATAQASCVPVPGAVQVAGDCDDANAAVQGGVVLYVGSAFGITSGTAHYVITQGATTHEGDMALTDTGADYAAGSVSVCLGAGCFSVQVTPNDVPLGEVAVVQMDLNPGQSGGFPVADGFFGSATPPASELCDGLDNDCDGEVDEDFRWYADADGDGFGDASTMQISCTPLPGFVQVVGDCNDADPGLTAIGMACDDGDPNTVNDTVRPDCSCLGLLPGECPPGEIADCNGNCAPAEWVGDGFCDDGSFEHNGNFIFFNCPEFGNDGGDCGGSGCVTEVCDGLDNDCDGEVDEDFVWYTDADADGFGDFATATISCTPLVGAVQLGGDCDDNDPATYPGAPEGCEGVDRNCDGIVPGANPNDVYSPDWTATATTGQSVNLYDLLAQGKTVVLDLFAAWCPPSQQMLTANFLQDWNAHMGPDGTDQIRIVAIAVDQSAGSVTPFIEEAQWPVIVQDGESFGPLYNAIGMYDNAVPTLLMICPDRSVTMLYPQPDDLPYTGLFNYDPAAGLALVNERCGCRSTCVANIGCMDPNSCDYDPDATCPGPCAQAQEWFADNDGDGVGGSSLGTACTQPPNSAPTGGDCDDDNASVQQGFTLIVLTNDPGDFGTAHYVIQHGGGILEGDLDLPQETEGIGELQVCIANGCYTISISQNDVLLWEEAYLLLPQAPEEPVVFSTFDGYQGGASAEVCDGIDNDCDGTVDEGCGNCSDADRAWILANQATIEGIVGNTFLSCGATEQCLLDALLAGTPLPESCATCVAQRYVCILESCLAQCVGGFGAPPCVECVNATCNAAYFACAGFTDNDGDGVVAELDCDDSDPNVFPGANEICDTIDNDCDGLIDETPTTYYADLDGDGWGDENNTVEGGCSPPNGATSQVGDCDDSDPDIYPGAPEICNGIDDDCDGEVDDNAGIAYYVDADGDGYGDINSEQFSCTPIPGLITQGGDCDDTDETINPGAADPCDTIDQDCSGGPVLSTWFVDNDGDGFGNDATTTQDCTQPTGYVAISGDCDDTNSDVFPGNGCSNCTLTEQAWLAANQQTLLAAVNDCTLQCFGDPTCIASCLQSSGVPLGAVCLSCIDGYLLCVQDNCSIQCLNSPEFCFSCQVQEGCLAALASCMGQVDADGDGWWAGSDCDDSNGSIFPGATEVCDGVDNDCDGDTDEGLSVTYYTDADGDGFGLDGTEITGTCDQPPGTATQGGDCDDADDTVFPGAPELCDGIDNDCNGETDDNAGTLYYTDADGDGYGDDATGQFSCTPIPGTVTLGGDCNDANDAINPGAADPCDAIDQDCSGGPVLTTWYQDNDGDGFGNDAVSLSDCVQPVGYVAQQGDCDDSNSDLFPGNGCSTCSVTEQQWLATNQQTLLNALNSCALQCLTGDPGCISSCLQDEGVPLGAFCLTCVEDYVLCWQGNCPIQCLGSEQACLECQLQSGCFATFASCLGMVDADEDGWWAGSDCDDNDPAVNPGASEVCNGVDDDCDGTVDNNTGDAYYPDADGDGFGDSDGMVLSCTPVPGFITQAGDCNDNDATVNPLGTETCNGLDDDCDGEVDEDCVLLDLKVLLDGPYSPSTGLMNDGLRALGLVPTTEPYSALGYSYTGGSATTTSAVVLATTGPDAIVDWVVVELRAGTDPTSVVHSRCALLQRDGDVVDLDGINPLSLQAAPGDLYVALRHRNHLGVMTAVPFLLSNTVTTIDLRTAAEACFGADARRSVSGAFPATTLWTGDVDRNNVVRYTGPANDRDPLLQAIGGSVPTNTTTGYLPQDVNMDGTVKYTGPANDRDPILQTVGGSVPTNTRSGTLP